MHPTLGRASCDSQKRLLDLLYFAQYGNTPLLKCDILLVEEGIATVGRIAEAHEIGREVGVWTANSEDSLRRVLDSEADYVITDKVSLAANVQEELDSRGDFEAIFEFVWGDAF